MRVLVADDDVDVRDALGELIRRHPQLELIDAVGDGSAAVEPAARHQPDVAIVDVHMPSGGAHAVRAIREASALTSVLAYTAVDDPRTERELLEAGAVAYVRKGVRTADLIAAILAAAGRSAGPSY